MAKKLLATQTFSTNRKTFTSFSFFGHLQQTGLMEQYQVKDKAHGGGLCTFVVGIEGQPETRLLTEAYFTSGLELNTSQLAEELAAMAAAYPDGMFIFEIYQL